MAEPQRILVVDDEADMVATLKDILQAEGYEVDVALSGLEALDRCRAQAPECVLMDVIMPDLDGVDTMDAMKQILPTVPVFFMTATVTPDLVSQAEAVGVREVLSKPLDLEYLLGQIRTTAAEVG
jgi:CheY-like chemotaxis protein